MLEVKVVGQERAGVNSQACTFINRLYIANKYGLYISYGNSSVREFERFNPGKGIGPIRTTVIVSDRYRTVLICRNRIGVEGAGIDGSILAEPAADSVITRTTRNIIISGKSRDGVITGEACDNVAPRSSRKIRIISRRARDLTYSP